MTMKDKKRIENDIINIFNRYGYSEFKWCDVKDIVENSPIYYHHSNALKCTGREGSCKIYKVNPAFFERGTEKQYRLKKSPLYPKKTWLASGVIK